MKKILAALLGIGLSVLLAACGASGGSGTKMSRGTWTGSGTLHDSYYGEVEAVVELEFTNDGYYELEYTKEDPEYGYSSYSEVGTYSFKNGMIEFETDTAILDRGSHVTYTSKISNGVLEIKTETAECSLTRVEEPKDLMKILEGKWIRDHYYEGSRYYAEISIDSNGFFTEERYKNGELIKILDGTVQYKAGRIILKNKEDHGTKSWIEYSFDEDRLVGGEYDDVVYEKQK